jgi:peptidase S41-like protein
MHAVDPIQRLRLLKLRSASLSEPDFHAELISIFTRLRDLHTNYILPEPLRTRTAYLPFRIEEFFEGDDRRYVVTEVKPGTEDGSFKRGVLVTHWNGTPIHRAVQLNADREAGSNLDARHARGLAAMTIRSLAMSLPPDEEWVVVTYLAGRRTQERRFEWQVFESGLPGGGNDPLVAAGDLALVLGLDAKAELERQARKLLFAPEAVKIDRLVKQQTDPDLGDGPAPDAVPVDFTSVSKMPDVFTFRTVDTPSGTYGYVRIHTFYVPNDKFFVDEFIRIVGLLPQNGLLLDVRGNGGGNILAGERLLQVLTPHTIDPERFYFINSPLTLRVCEANQSLTDWRESIAQAVETGAAFSHGFSLRPVEAYNDIGQKYQGPVVLVTDARCYSTTDIFSAGFQDHGIGKILGTSGATGAGGANVWGHELLLTMLPAGDSPFKPLPKKASFRVAIRRCTRVGKRSGVLVEDLGVVPDAIHRMTKQDVLSGNIDLINRAGEMLTTMPFSTVRVTVQNSGTAMRVDATTKNITRLDVFLNTRPFRSLDVVDGTTSMELPPLGLGSKTLELRGFRSDQLVVSTRVPL